MSGNRLELVGIVSKLDSRKAASESAEVCHWLERRGVVVHLAAQTQEAAGLEGYEAFDPVRSYDLIVVLGGDGTLMSVARSLETESPILGVNLGSLGFLTEVGATELYPSLTELLARPFETEPRLLLDVELERVDGTVASFRALNDVVVTKSALSRIIDIRVDVDGRLVARYRSDGLILSTPSGSTAYNLSAGGPIAHPQLPVVVLTPICPHALNHRPLVVPDSSLVLMTVESGDERVFLTIDGQEGMSIEHGERVRVCSSERQVRLVKISGRSFYDSLRSKLRWGG